MRQGVQDPMSSSVVKSIIFILLPLVSLAFFQNLSVHVCSLVNWVFQATDDYLFSIDPAPCMLWGNTLMVHLHSSVVLPLHGCFSFNLSLQGWHCAPATLSIVSSVRYYHQIYAKQMHKWPRIQKHHFISNIAGSNPCMRSSSLPWISCYLLHSVFAELTFLLYYIVHHVSGLKALPHINSQLNWKAFLRCNQ